MKRKKQICLFLALLLMSMSVISISQAAVKPRISKKKLKLNVGERKKLKVKNAKKQSTIKWKSNKPKIATVKKNGLVIAKKAGKAKITARIQGKVFTCKVTVLKKEKTAHAGKTTKRIPSKKPVITKPPKTVPSKQPMTQNPSVSPTGNPVQTSDTPQKNPATTQPPYIGASDFASQMSDFSVRLLQNSSIDDIASGKNALISPESVITALMMTANGTNGTTKSQMEQVLCGTLSQDDFNQKLSEFNNNLCTSDKVKFHIANSIWVRDDAGRIQMKDDFLQKNLSLYQAEAFLEPFNETTVSKINEWVNTNTSEMIPQIISEISEEQVMYLINALAFEGKWQEQYLEEDVKEDEIFTNAQGTQEKANMLYGQEYQYIHDDQAEGFLKGYEGGKYAFMAILPKEGMSVSEYLSSMTGESLQKLYHSQTRTKVLTKMPEFSYEYTKYLKSPLAAMGMENAFLPTADFSNMAQTESGELFIGDVLHKTFIQLDRNGTKAAAVTAVIMNDAAAAMPPENTVEVYLDRPFAYAIVDTKTGLPIFIGAVNSVKSN